MEDESPVADRLRRRIELHRERPLDPVCAFISEQDPVVGNHGTGQGAELFSLMPPDLEYVLECRIERDLERKPSGIGSVVRQADVVGEIQPTSVDLSRPGDADRFLGDEPTVCHPDLGIRRLEDCPSAGSGGSCEWSDIGSREVQLVSTEVPAIVVVEPEAMVAGQRNPAVRLAKEEDIQALDDDRVGNTAHDRRRALAQHAVLVSLAALAESHWLI